MSDRYKTRTSVLERARHGEAEEFAEIYRCFAFECARRLGLSHHDAEDVAQETVFELLERVREFQYDPERGTFRGLVWTVVRRRMIDLLRKNKKWRPLSSERLESLEAPGNEVEAMFDREWEKALYLAALDIVRTRVKPSTFQSFDLYCLRGWPIDEVKRQLGLSADQIYQNKHRVISALKKYFNHLQGREG